MAKGSLTKTKVIALMAEKMNLKKSQVEEFFNAQAELAVQHAESCFLIPGIGKLVKFDRPERQGKDPRTGETKTYPAKTQVKFRVSSVCKKAVLGEE